LASTERNSGRTPAREHHQSFADKLVEDALFPQTHVGPSPPPHLNSLPGKWINNNCIYRPFGLLTTQIMITAHQGVNQLLRRAAAAAAIRRERINSSQSDEVSSKRHRSSGDNTGVLGNNNNPDVLTHMPQITATDFSTIKHNNNLSPQIKDSDRHMINKTPIGKSTRFFTQNRSWGGKLTIFSVYFSML
jgi:broad-complex core protein